MKLNLCWLLTGCCLLLSPTNNAVLFDTVPVLTGPITEKVFNDTLLTIFSTFGTTLDEIQSKVDVVIDGLLDKIYANITNTPDVELDFLKILSKSKAARAPPLNFNCQSNLNFKSNSKPTNINKVRIGDIKCIGLMGDSVAAGLGTIGDTIASATLYQGRGYCSKSGGAGSVADGNTTLPNMMRDLYGDIDLKGYSTAEGNCIQTSTCSSLNVANILAFHPDYVAQAILLVKRILFGSTCRYDDWKMIHIFYGVNDLCLLCDPTHYQDLIMMGLDMRIAITILKTFLPNTLVYVHIPYDLRPIASLSTNLGCSVVQDVLCPCAALPATQLLGNVKTNQESIAKVWHNIAMEFNSPTSNFHISEIKHLTNTQPPKDANGNLQPEILGGNCLHPNRAAHHLHARYTLQEMFMHPDERPLEADYTVNIETPFNMDCPPGDGYLRTYYN